jgi:hypothetical protein
VGFFARLVGPGGWPAVPRPCRAAQVSGSLQGRLVSHGLRTGRWGVGVPVLFCSYSQNERDKDENEHPLLFRSKDKCPHQIISNGSRPDTEAQISPLYCLHLGQLAS